MQHFKHAQVSNKREIGMVPIAAIDKSSIVRSEMLFLSYCPFAHLLPRNSIGRLSTIEPPCFPPERHALPCFQQFVSHHHTTLFMYMLTPSLPLDVRI